MLSGAVLILLFLIEIIWILLEIRKAWYEYRIYHCIDKPNSDLVTEFLYDRIQENLWVCGIDMQPGWNKTQTEQLVYEIFLDVPVGVYLKINDLMEKYFYGGGSLEADERRLLWNFLVQIRRGRKSLSLHQRLRLRFLMFGKNR